MERIFVAPPGQRICSGRRNNYLHNSSVIFQLYLRGNASLRRGWNLEIVIFLSILLSLEEKEVNLDPLGWKRGEASLSLGGKEEKERFNHLTIDLSSRSRFVSTRGEGKARGVLNVSVFFS